ncbi:ROK family protein [Agromyces cerinus]|uniref:Glucokinase n=1 Tax=Agromyces cerinus subsp. cerinus TaxID=232089 RepID=A0A1N6IC49_9MICO|nr:ROK family protein [Agromyces cerinus]SIO29569.1 glucokinase [Agromyces cerinus subsp. cerinus]
MRTVAIDLGGTTLKLGVVEDRALVSHLEVPLTSEFHLDQVEAVVRDQLDGASVDSVGIAVPGIVDAGGTHLVAAHGKYSALHRVNLSEWSQTVFGSPAVVENDARAALMGEVADGVAAGASDVVLLALGTGVGTAAMIDGRLVRGRHGHAGVLNGHVTVAIDGHRCPCGNIGCAETLASTWALRQAVSAGELEPGPALADRLVRHGAIGVRDIVETRHEPASASLLERFYGVWAAVLVTQCHSFDPDVVVVTGGVMRSADLILPELRRRVHDRLWSSSFRPPLVTPEDPATSVLRGVAALASRNNEGHV